MPQARDRKLFLGPRLRMLRREMGLTQTRMAEELGVSPSYLNHLERNQRPLTAPMLLRLADTYDLDMRGFVAGAREAAVGDLTEILADDLTRDLTVDRQETLEVAENYPNVAEALKRLYRAVVDLRQQPGRIESGLAQGGAASPIAWAREWVDARRNHFPAIDLAAEELAAGIGGDSASIETAVRDRLAAQHTIGVRLVPQETLPAATWHYDVHRRRLLLSERLAPASRLFALALHLARLELAGPIGDTLAGAGAPDREAAALGRRVLDAYSAAAILMPYRGFLAAAEAGRYDLDLLAARFGTSIEQVAHRLTTLSRTSQAGVPLFLLKLDLAGNVVKRFSGVRGPFTSFGGGCPRWRVHDALHSAGGSVVDLAELPDGSRFLTWARALRAYPQRRPSLLILGCDVRDAARVGYMAAVTGEPTPIGVACHLCERERCEERSLPPITRGLATDHMSRPIDRYRFGAV